MSKQFGNVLIISNGRLGDFVSSFVIINPIKSISNRVEVICKDTYKDIIDNEQDLYGVTREEAFGKEYDLLLDLTSTSNTRSISTKIKASRKIGSYRTFVHKIRSYLLGTYTHSFKSIPFNQFTNTRQYYDRYAQAVGAKCHELPVLRKLLSPTIGSIYTIQNINPVVGIHISATDPIRQLPLELIRETIVYIASLGGASILIGEKERAREIGFDLPSTYYKEESINELIAILSQVDYLIGADSGVLHLAGALGTRSLGIYGPNLSKMFGPPGKTVEFLELDLECRPCTNSINCEYNIRCLNDIEFTDVKKSIDRNLIDKSAL